MAVVEISVTPLGTGTTSVSNYVAGCVRIAKKSGLKIQLTPMGTILEGPMEGIWPVLAEMQAHPFSEGAEHVSTLIKIDDRRDGHEHTLEGKVSSVEEKLSGG